MFLVTGCQTTQSAEIESEIPKATTTTEKESNTEVTTPEPNFNPFKNKDIPTNMVVRSKKPVHCGKLDTYLNNLQKKFGEIPVFVGHSKVMLSTGEQKAVMVTMMMNLETGTFSFMETMPIEERLVCMLSSGKGQLRIEKLKKEQKL